MTNIKPIAFALLITAAATLPLKAAEQCCQPCPNGVLVGVTADSCGTCIDLSEFIPGCNSADASGCQTCGTGFYKSGKGCTACNITLPSCTSCSDANTCNACAAGFTLAAGKCTTAAASISGINCNGPKFVTGVEHRNDYSEFIYSSSFVFIPNCTACAATYCAACAAGYTLQQGFCK